MGGYGGACVWGEGVEREWGRVWGGCGGGDVRMKGKQGRYDKRLVNENTVAVRNEWIPTMCTVMCYTHVHGHTVFQHGDPRLPTLR